MDKILYTLGKLTLIAGICMVVLMIATLRATYHSRERRACYYAHQGTEGCPKPDAVDRIVDRLLAP